MKIKDLKENECIECKNYSERQRIKQLLDSENIPMKAGSKWMEHDFMVGFGSVFLFPKKGMYSNHETENIYQSELFT
jgi:hypothetical protein